MIYILDKKDFSSDIDNRMIRLFIPNIDNKGEYFVDQYGRVLHNKEMYSVSPFNFLLLNDYLDYLKLINGIREGIPFIDPKTVPRKMF